MIALYSLSAMMLLLEIRNTTYRSADDDINKK
jgi:hypothetical protein